MMIDAEVAPTKVFLLEDHAIVRDGLVALLEDAGFVVVGTADVVEGTVEKILDAAPDVAVLDISLPDGSGIDVCRAVVQDHEGPKCLVLTSASDEMALFDAVSAGASGFLLKQIGGNDLIDAIEQLQAGRSLIDPTLVGRVVDRLRDTLDRDSTSPLTDRERQIAALIAEGCSNKEIGRQLFLAEKTVRNNITMLLRKLDMRSRHDVMAAVLAGNLSVRR